MPEFVSRWWGRFEARTGVQKVLIILVALVVLAIMALAALVVLAILSPVVAALAGLIFVVALIALGVQLIRRRPARVWAIVAGGSLVVALAFWGLSSALLSGPEAEDQPRVERAEKPQPEKQPPKPPTNEEQAPKPTPKPKPEPTPKPEDKPEQKPQERSLYEQAVIEPLAPYKVDYTASDTVGRLDVFVVTERTTNKPRLGRILIDLQENSEHEPDLVTAAYCTKPGEQSCTDTLFATGEYAATAQGKSFMTGEQVLSKVGKWPSIKVEF